MEKLEINVSSQLQRKIEVLSREFGISKEESILFILNTFFFEKSEAIYEFMEKL